MGYHSQLLVKHNLGYQIASTNHRLVVKAMGSHMFVSKLPDGLFRITICSINRNLARDFRRSEGLRRKTTFRWFAMTPCEYIAAKAFLRAYLCGELLRLRKNKSPESLK
ncbi:MAG: hypothetical protein D4R81_11205 [Nitrospiraceae bacterium]|nr:MAG: hypothetical protein D4R81_11205 [Nitrospiraceae bacterium]